MKKKQILFGSIGLICLVILVGAIYLIISKDNIPAIAAEKNNGQKLASVDIVDQVSNVVTLIPTSVPDKPYIAEIDEVINSKPVGGNDTSLEVTEAPIEDIKVDPVDVSQDDSANEDLKVDSNDKDIENKDVEAKETVKKDTTPSKDTKKEEPVIVDESPKTVKEDKVKEYEGGEKTGSGNSLKDLFGNISVKPEEGEVDGDVPASGIEVGSWN